MNILELMKVKLAEIQEQFDSDYENQYYEGCDRADMAIDVLNELIAEMEAQPTVNDSFNNIENSTIIV